MKKRGLVSVVAASSLVAMVAPVLPVYAAPKGTIIDCAEVAAKERSTETKTNIVIQKGDSQLGDPNREVHQEYNEAYISFSRYTHEDGTPYTGLYKSQSHWLVLDKDGFDSRDVQNPQYAWMDGMYTADFLKGAGPNLNQADGKTYLADMIIYDDVPFDYFLKQKWIQIAGQWFYADEDGVCYQNEWVKINGNWYYFNSDFAMATNTTIDGYVIGKDGKLVE